MANKPVIGDLIGWLKLQSDPNEATKAVYQEALDVAIDDIETRCDNAFVLATGDGDMLDAENYPRKMRVAILMDAARIAKRSTSPEGVAGMSDLGTVIRILGSDPDIERFIARYKKMDGFS